MKKGLTALIVLTMIAAMLMSCGGGSKSLMLIQNKPEIDPQLQAYGKIWTEKSGIDITIKSIGGSSSIDLGTQLKADYAAGEMADIFVINGLEDYKEWENIVLDLSDQEWVKDTAVAFKYNGKVYGFPVAVEGWGMAYNADVLKEAGVNPSTLVTYQGYKEAFEKIDLMKNELGLDSVVSMAASMDMKWVTAHHNFNSLLSNGLPYGDMSVVNNLLAGNVDMNRLEEYADWVELLFMYADEGVLTTGNYDDQVGAFAAGKAAFLHQGNWVDPNMADANATFKMAYAPHGSSSKTTDGIFVSAPSFYVVNKESKNVDAALQYLKDLVYTQAGHNYMVNEAGMIPAFGTVKLNPAGQLSQSVQAWAAEGKVYSWSQYHFSGDFRDTTLGPIYNQFATGSIDKAQFVNLMAEAFKNR